jgi:Ca2+/Na+ antiporter
MAGGSSSPELFTAIIGIEIELKTFVFNDYVNLGIFVAKGDVGVGTIVGSAVFNVVCVIGICGLFVNGVSFEIEFRENK